MEHTKNIETGERAEHTTLMDELMQLMRQLRRGPGGGHHSHGHGRLLWLIAADEACTPGELARRLNIRPPSLSEKIKALTEQGLVEKLPHPDDSRKNILRLTDGGRQFLEEHRANRHAGSAEVFTCLTSAEREQFLALCQKLRAHAEAALEGSSGDRASDGHDAHCGHGHHA